MSIDVYRECLMNQLDNMSLDPSFNQEYRGECHTGSCSASLRLCTDGITEVIAGACSNQLRANDTVRTSPRMTQNNPFFNNLLSDPLL